MWVFNTELFGWVSSEWCRGFDEVEAEGLLDELDEEIRSRIMQGSELEQHRACRASLAYAIHVSGV